MKEATGTDEREPKWQNLDVAMADPLFQQCMGIMGTANTGQDMALLAVLNHFNASLGAAQVPSRKAFEAHMLKLNACTRLNRQSENLGGHYRTVTVQRAWELWQAALSQPFQQGTKS